MCLLLLKTIQLQLYICNYELDYYRNKHFENIRTKVINIFDLVFLEHIKLLHDAQTNLVTQ